MTCDKCGGNISTKKIREYRADELVGLTGVTVVGEAMQRICAQCKSSHGVSLPDPEGLEAAIALTRACLPTRLDGETIRFMRGALGLRSKEMARHLEVRDETLSRWENDKEQISAIHEKALRFFVINLLGERAPAVGCCSVELMQMNLRNELPGHPHLVFHRIKVRVSRESQWGWDREPETETEIRQRA